MRLPLCPDPSNRIVPMKNLTFRETRVTPPLKKEISEWFTHSLKNGAYSKVEGCRSSHDDNGTKYIAIDGRIYAVSGTCIGDFHRAVYDDFDGIKVDHAGFDIYENFQAGGIGTDFINKSFAAYAQRGVDRVTVYASDYMGGFVWARMGFRIRNDTIRHTVIKWMVERVQKVVKETDLSSAKKRHITSDINRLLSRSENGEDIQPCHIAELGEEYAVWTTRDGITMWPGKKALMNYGAWDGVYYFDGRQK